MIRHGGRYGSGHNDAAGARGAKPVPQVEVTPERFGYDANQHAAFVTVLVRNTSSRKLRVLTVECRFLLDDGRNVVTMLLFRDLPAGGEDRGFTYSYSSIPAVGVKCAQSGVRY